MNEQRDRKHGVENRREMISLTGGSMRDDVLHCSEDNASHRLKATGAGHPTKQFLHSPTKKRKDSTNNQNTGPCRQSRRGNVRERIRPQLYAYYKLHRIRKESRFHSHAFRASMKKTTNVRNPHTHPTIKNEFNSAINMTSHQPHDNIGRNPRAKYIHN